MTYGSNGNILSKTGLGSYEYGSSSRPHAVTAVDNTDDMLAVYEQEDSQNGTWTDVVAAMTDHLGSITCLMDDFDDWVLTHPLYMHEYGHSIDSRGYGPSYLFTIGWSSMNSARTYEEIGPRTTHDWHWTELRANNNASRYFQKNYTSVDWSNYTNFYKGRDYYPLVAPVFTRQEYRYLRRFTYTIY